MRRHGLGASSRILAQLVTEADFEIATALQLPVESPVFVLKRVRLANGEPVSIQTAHIPAALVPGLEVAEGDSLYKALEANYRLYAARARETYFASAADPATALELGIPANSPVYAVERVTLLLNEKPFEFARSIIRGDRYSIVLDLVKDGSKKNGF
jgi:GntR family transcriptional regulator